MISPMERIKVEIIDSDQECWCLVGGVLLVYFDNIMWVMQTENCVQNFINFPAA